MKVKGCFHGNYNSDRSRCELEMTKRIQNKTQGLLMDRFWTYSRSKKDLRKLQWFGTVHESPFWGLHVKLRIVTHGGQTIFKPKSRTTWSRGQASLSKATKAFNGRKRAEKSIKAAGIGSRGIDKRKTGLLFERARQKFYDFLKVNLVTPAYYVPCNLSAAGMCFAFLPSFLDPFRNIVFVFWSTKIVC